MRRRGEIPVVFRVLVLQVPQLQEHERKAPHGLALEHDGGVLPVAVLFLAVDVLVRQVDAAVEGCVAVDHQNLAVIAVVVVRRKERRERGEHPALDAQLFQALRIVVRQGGKLVRAVVEQAHLHALLRLARQNLEHPAPHQPLVDDEVLQKDEFLRLLKLREHPRPLVLAQREVGHVRAVVCGMAAAAAHVAHQRRGMGVFRLQTLHDRRVLPDPAPVLLGALPDALAHGPVTEVAARVHIQQRAEHGHDHDDHQPGDLRGGVKAAVQQDGHHDDVHHDGQRIQMRQKLRKPPGDRKQQKQLQKKQQHDDAQTAENDGEQALLALLQQRQTLTLPGILLFHMTSLNPISPVFLYCIE